MTELSQSTPPGQQSDASMKDKAADTADAAKHAAGDVANTATDKAKDVVGEAQRQARNLVGEARDQVNDQVSSQHRNLVDNLRTLADEFGRMADASEQPGLASELVGQAGDRARTAAEWIGDRQPGDLLDEVRSFARRRPGTFVLGALVAGVAVGRLTRGVVAAHTDDGSTDGASAASVDATTTQTLPSTTGYSAPPAHQGLPTESEGSVYGVAEPSEVTSGMPSAPTPPGTFPRDPEPPAPGQVSS
jgi:hypothetical protein